ncbi:FAD dependent oxidoreductase [Halteromyces radiatus]|uniref:FAD dependent oxidoreductase n=1 Tax=Halteromyces radiatus TaxID=101107 RepID=UPI00221EFB77|nr:FAD dependent oxidoreductase [Halteromyces radiatus]KAI8079718.1 FAD dependent oxidoreductase [Halteromyces radiatus]
MSFRNVVILGAGVSGLTTGITLLRNGAKQVTVVGKYIPGGDKDAEYASAFAGASIITFASVKDKRLQEIDRYTYNEFHRLANQEPESGVVYCPGYQYYEREDAPGEDNHWVRDLFQDYAKLNKDELPEGIAHGYRFVAFTANVPQYLGWLIKTFKSLGGKLERQAFDSLQSVMETYKDADTLINCAGAGSKYLKDVQDNTMYPVRGQTVVVRAPHVKFQLYRDVSPVETYCTYIIPRSDGTVVCGGTMDVGNTNPEADPQLTKTILENCYKLHPYLTHGQGPDAFDIVSVNVGLRPGRKDGIRLEKEIKYRTNGDRVIVCHNYGHSSHGYQSSWGSSAKVLQLLKDERISKL